MLKGFFGCHPELSEVSLDLLPSSAAEKLRRMAEIAQDKLHEESRLPRSGRC
jgi:hypothetical protein